MAGGLLPRDGVLGPGGPGPRFLLRRSAPSAPGGRNIPAKAAKRSPTCGFVTDPPPVSGKKYTQNPSE